MPGSAGFEETARGIDLRKPTRRSVFEAHLEPDAEPIVPDEVRADPDTLEGKTLMLNLAVGRGFHCGGFQLSLHRPFAVVGVGAQLAPIQAALTDGRLVDITGQDPKKGFKTRDGSVSKVAQEDTGKQVFIGRTAKGEAFVAIPKNKKQASQYERDVKRTGTISNLDLSQAAMGLSGVTTEDVPLDAQGCLILPGSTPTRGKLSVVTSRPQRNSRRR